jgi:anti-sigma B factor antagonist
MDVRQESTDDALVVHVGGDVDMRSSPELRTILLQACVRKQRGIVVNLKNVRYIDSSGIATLVECLKNCSRRGGTLTLVGVNERIYPVFELAHLHTVFDIRRDNETR